MKKIVVSSLLSLLFFSCSVYIPNNSTQDVRMPHRDFRWSQYAPTSHLSLTRDTSSHSPLTTHYSPIKEDFTALAKKYNFAELEKEYNSPKGTPVSIDSTYKSFSTKAL